MTTRAGGQDWARKAQRGMGEYRLPVVSDTVAATAQVESWLQKNGVVYAPAMMIPMDVIDEKRSRANQARKEALISDSVERYTAGFKRGDKFPPIVGHQQAGRFVIIDGNNRQAAAKKAGLKEIYAIMVSAETPSEMIALLTIEANAHHGKTPDSSWRIQQAFQLIGYGFSVEDAAEKVALSPATVRMARSAQEADQRARAMKVANFGPLADTAKQLLNGLRDDPIFFQAASVAAKTEMSIDEVRAMVRMIKSQKNESDRLAAIGQIADDKNVKAAALKALGKKTGLSSPSHSLSSAAGKLMKIDPAQLVRQILTTRDRDNAKRYVKDLETKLLDIMIALETLDDMDGDG